ncbi:MAG: hypothetical protein IKQ06_06235 [Bacilli bacterium]|nr:hypothetical protein [Bacilli bacterium]MBR6137736.1 hypothetical protein [Bacilli bacterium]
MIIIQDFIKNHINYLTINDLRRVADKYELKYSEDELFTIYSFIKDYYQDLLMKNDKVLVLLKDKINKDLYDKLIDLYVNIKDKYL